MALKDRLTDALNSTPAENQRRQETLRAVLAAAGDKSADGDVAAVISKVIADREQKAASFSAAGQSDLAKGEREEIDALRGFLRLAGEPQAAPKKAKPAAAAEIPGTGKSDPLISRTQMIIVAVAAIVLVAGALIYFFGFSSNSDNEMLTSGPSTAITVFKDDRTLGSPNAPIKMLEYAAPTCPHCAHFDETVMPLIKKTYIETGKVFYIFRVFPLGNGLGPSDAAAEAIARCLPADKYFWFIDLLFRNQSKWDPEYGITDVRGALIQLAKLAGMGPAKVDQCISDKDEQDRINAVAQDGETKYNIQGTPTFVINGDVSEDPSWAGFQTKFDSLLSKKK